MADEIREIRASPDLDSMTLEELEKALGGAGEVTVTERAKPEVREPAKPEPKPEKEPDVEPEGDLDFEILKARLAEKEIEAQKWQRLASRHAGELGYLKKRIEAGPEPSAEEEDETEDRHPPRGGKRRAESDDSLRSWAVKSAVKDAVRDFWDGNQDMAKESEAIYKHVREIAAEAGSDGMGDLDPDLAQKTTLSFLNEAKHRHLMARHEERIKELTTKKAEQVKKLEEAKRKGSISGSGASSAGTAEDKTLAEMSVEDLEKLMKKMARR